MSDDEILGGILRRLLLGESGWSFGCPQPPDPGRLAIGGVCDINDEESDAIYRATEPLEQEPS